jgi:hypothetical protein
VKVSAAVARAVERFWIRLAETRRHGGGPHQLLVMRLDQMTTTHPDQDSSRVCSRCRQPVGVYPSGQAVLARSPETEIICDVCHAADPNPPRIQISAPGALEEAKRK